VHVLTVLDHPDPTSFSAAVAKKFKAGAISSGHTVEIADLHAEGFDPRYRMADIEGDGRATTAADVLKRNASRARMRFVLSFRYSGGACQA